MENETLNNKVAGLKEAIKEKNQTIAQLQKDLNVAQVLAEEKLNEEKQILEAKLERANLEVSDMLKKYNEMKAQSDREKLAADERIKKLETKIESLKDKIEDSFSAKEAERDMIPYNRVEIIRLARQLLLEDPSLGLADIIAAKTKKQRDLEIDLTTTLASRLNIYTDKIPCVVWRLTKIPDDDFEKVLPGFAQFTTNKQICKAMTSYERRRKLTVDILSNSADESGVELEKKIDLLAGKDWDFILKERNIWRPSYNEDKHLRLIMGKWYPKVGDKD
uniref:Uncharacterized protein n=1 Tax=Panagrolaimus davidi TaxID=227884 RepID=A0A914QJV6_9BILA